MTENPFAASIFSDNNFTSEEQDEIFKSMKTMKTIFWNVFGIVIVIAIAIHFAPNLEKYRKPAEQIPMLVSIYSVLSLIVLTIAIVFRNVRMKKSRNQVMTTSLTRAVSETGKNYQKNCLVAWSLGEVICFYGVVLFVFSGNIMLAYPFFAVSLVFLWWAQPKKEEFETLVKFQKQFHNHQRM